MSYLLVQVRERASSILFGYGYNFWQMFLIPDTERISYSTVMCVTLLFDIKTKMIPARHENIKTNQKVQVFSSLDRKSVV